MRTYLSILMGVAGLVGAALGCSDDETAVEDQPGAGGTRANEGGSAGAGSGGSDAGGTTGEAGAPDASGGSTSVAGTSSGGAAGAAGATSGACSFEVEAELSPAIATVGIVTWSVAMDDLDEAHIEFGLTTTGFTLEAPVELAAEEHRTLLLRSEEHTSELQSQSNLVCRLLL